MFLFWDLTSPSPPGEGGRKVRGTAVTLWDACPEPFPSVLLSPIPSWVWPSGDCQGPPCSHQIAMAVLASWSCPYSTLTLAWDLPPLWTASPLKARSSLAPAVSACRIQQLPLCSPGQPGAAGAELVM